MRMRENETMAIQHIRIGVNRMNAPFASIDEDVAVDIALDTVTTEGWNLVLYNDEHNTFDHVIEMLISICEHDALQAEQCALMVHFKGKCAVMSGTYDELEPKCSKLLKADLTAEIEA
tara:strand:- start:2785 stop:3138 length:354 start_codon:yes stop_codon:yes gene_type:complete